VIKCIAASVANAEAEPGGVVAAKAKQDILLNA
jgi:hypothetical protein